MSSNISIDPSSLSLSSETSGLIVRLTDFSTPPSVIAASGITSLACAAWTAAIRSSTQMPSAPSRSFRLAPTSSGAPSQMRFAAALAVTILSVGSRVTTPFDMLASIESL